MAVETAADRLTFFDADEFAVDVTYTPLSGSAIAFTGIFDDAHLAVEMGGEAAVSTTAPVLTCRADDLDTLSLGEARQGDGVEIGGASYTVTDVQPDGTGIVMLVLEKQ